MTNRDLFESARLSGHHFGLFEFLLGNFLWSRFGCTGNSDFVFAQHNFNVTWGGHVWVDTTVSSVCSSSLLSSSVDLDMVDDESINVKAFNFGIGFSILQHTENDLTRFFWPSTL